ncbi:MAG TPA: hypothetical protein VLZ77_14725 [Acidimicrobiales bacterium]|nr:hypothetical protein [Acidimicrobiales bacterium]
MSATIAIANATTTLRIMHRLAFRAPSSPFDHIVRLGRVRSTGRKVPSPPTPWLAVHDEPAPENEAGRLLVTHDGGARWSAIPVD